MRKIEAETLQSYSGGVDTAACFVSGFFVALTIANWWNPIGYLSAQAAMAAGLACVVGGNP